MSECRSVFHTVLRLIEHKAGKRPNGTPTSMSLCLTTSWRLPLDSYHLLAANTDFRKAITRRLSKRLSRRLSILWCPTHLNNSRHPIRKANDRAQGAVGIPPRREALALLALQQRQLDAIGAYAADRGRGARRVTGIAFRDDRPGGWSCRVAGSGRAGRRGLGVVPAVGRFRSGRRGEQQGGNLAAGHTGSPAQLAIQLEREDGPGAQKDRDGVHRRVDGLVPCRR